MPDGAHQGSFRGDASTTLDGHYSRIFEIPAAEFGDDAKRSEVFRTLANAMLLAEGSGIKSQDSVLPAGYTYFAQFVSHDLTFDPSTVNQRRLDPRYLEDYRSPRFDLDSVYGRGPDDQPYLYADDRTFALGKPLDVGFDLPRSARRAIAIIGDPRNDQNVMISQLHCLFLRLHNRIAREHPSWSFLEIQEQVQLHYQYVVLTDLLPRLIGSKSYGEFVEQRNGLFSAHGLSLLGSGSEPALPVEFAAAAYRLGHSMVRGSYRLNRVLPPIPLLGSEPVNRVAFFAKPMLSMWNVEWDLFLDMPGVPRGPYDSDALQHAQLIDGSLTLSLGEVPTLGQGPTIAGSLAERTLLRGYQRGLPNGQRAAAALRLDVLADEQIQVGNVVDGAGHAICEIDPVFKNNSPLWIYVLAEAVAAREADRQGGVAEVVPRQLGALGGRIVAETFLTLLTKDRRSILNRSEPFEPLFPGAPFDLAALVQAASAS